MQIAQKLWQDALREFEAELERRGPTLTPGTEIQQGTIISCCINPNDGVRHYTVRFKSNHWVFELTEYEIKEK